MADTGRAVTAPPARWWKYAVLRGAGIPALLDGVWYDLDEMRGGDGPIELHTPEHHIRLEATNMWEQRDDGEVAVVYDLSMRQLSLQGTRYDNYPRHALHGVPAPVLDAARSVLRAAAVVGDVEQQMVDPLADAVVMALVKWLKP